MASPAREILRVKDRYDGVVVADVKLEDGSISAIPITDLPRTELIRAAAMVFPPASRRWTEYGNEVIREAILNKTLPPLQNGNGSTPTPVIGIPVTGEVVPEEPEMPTGYGDVRIPRPVDPTPTPVPNGVIEQAIRQIAQAAAATSVNEDRVREIALETATEVSDFAEANITNKVTDLVKEATANLRPHQTLIVIDKREPITLPGRQHKEFANLLKLVALRRNVYLVGPPGTGKTYMAHAACQALSVEFGAISCSPTMPDSRIFGYMDANGKYVRTVFRDRFEYGGGFLFDEGDNGHPGVLAAINQALANSQCAFPDGMVAKSPDFFAMIAGNTYGTGATRQFIGRNELDAATLDRFVFLEIAIDNDLEESLVQAELPGEPGILWLNQVRAWRESVQRQSLNVAITPRTSVNGAMMLAAGFTTEQVTQMVARKGLSDDTWRKVNS